MVHLGTGPRVSEAVLEEWHTGWKKIDALYVMSGCECGQKRWGEKTAEVAAAPGYGCSAEIHANVCASGVKEKEYAE